MFLFFLGRERIKWLSGMGQKFLLRFSIRTAIRIQIACICQTLSYFFMVLSLGDVWHSLYGHMKVENLERLESWKEEDDIRRCLSKGEYRQVLSHLVEFIFVGGRARNHMECWITFSVGYTHLHIIVHLSYISNLPTFIRKWYENVSHLHRSYSF